MEGPANDCSWWDCGSLDLYNHLMAVLGCWCINQYDSNSMN